MFHESDLNFQADDKLITLFLSSLKFEYNFGDVICNLGSVSPTIFFIYEGQIEVILKDKESPFLILDSGCYFGDISFLFELNNKYIYKSIMDEETKKHAMIFSID